jgi:hypothetical protein
VSGFLIERTDQGGGFVTPPGSDKSYTPFPHLARVFPTREAAEADRCVGNERVVRLADAMAR